MKLSELELQKLAIINTVKDNQPEVLCQIQNQNSLYPINCDVEIIISNVGTVENNG